MTPAKTILLVDDQKFMRRLLSLNLAPLGCTLLEAEDGAQAIAAASSRLPDLAIIDVMLPGIDGFEVIRRLRTLPGAPRFPVILLTARGQSETRSLAEDLGVAAFFNKPFSPIELTATVRQLLRLDS